MARGRYSEKPKKNTACRAVCEGVVRILAIETMTAYLKSKRSFKAGDVVRHARLGFGMVIEQWGAWSH